MAFCPNCNAAIAGDAEDCDVCGTSFGSDTWLPLDSQAGSRPPAGLAALIFKLGLASVLLPVAGFVIGALITALLPGCRCEEGLGCRGCGANGLTEFLLYDGLLAGLAAVMFVFPVSAVLAVLVARMKSNPS